MNAISASGFDWHSIVEAASGSSALIWLTIAGILAAATGACPHLYL